MSMLSPSSSIKGASFGRSMRRLTVKEEPPATWLGRMQEVITSRSAFPVWLVVAVACVAYAFAVTRYHASHVTLLERLHAAELEYDKLLLENSLLLAGGDTSCSVREKAETLATSEIPKAPQAEGFPWIAGCLVLGGIGSIGRIMGREYLLFHKKQAETSVPFSVVEMAQYRLDHFFSTSKWAKSVLLLMSTFALILVGAISLCLASGDSLNITMWQAWTFVADPGTHADAEGTGVRLVAFLVTMGGMLVFALMIGIISESIGEKVDELKRGKSKVLENGHSLILGWNDKALAIIQEIALANQSEGFGVIVVLTETDKETMEEGLRDAIESRENALNLHGTEVIFRCGNTLNLHDLDMVSVSAARSVIALAQENVDPDVSDSRMVRQVLSLKGIEGFSSPVVVEMQDWDNKDLVEMIASDIAEVIVAHDVIGRLMIQCARQPGLAHVLENLMGFDGSEFYMQNWPELEGVTFGELLTRFDDAIAVGLMHTDGSIVLNPSDDHVISDGDEILVLAEDNDSYKPNPHSWLPAIPLLEIPEVIKSERPEKLLFCGWRRDMADMILQLDGYVPKGSELWLFNTVPANKRCNLLQDKGQKEAVACKNLIIKNVLGSPVVRRDLWILNAIDDNGEIQNRRDENGDLVLDEYKNPIPDSTTLDKFDSVLILADSGTDEKSNMESTDSRSLASMLIIQDIQKKLVGESGAPMCDPISEILDRRTRSLLNIAGGSGYIMSNQIVSAVIAQVSERREMNCVLGELLAAEGNEPYIREISLYLDLDQVRQYSFWELVLIARKRNEVCLGYVRGMATDLENERTMLNPPNKSTPLGWEAGDTLIVLAVE